MKSEKINHQYSEDTRLALLEKSINTINDTMVRFEKKFDKIDEKFDKLDSKIDMKINSIDSKLDNKFNMLFGLILTSMILPIILHALKWI